MLVVLDFDRRPSQTATEQGLSSLGRVFARFIQHAHTNTITHIRYAYAFCGETRAHVASTDALYVYWFAVCCSISQVHGILWKKQYSSIHQAFIEQTYVYMHTYIHTHIYTCYMYVCVHRYICTSVNFFQAP